MTAPSFVQVHHVEGTLAANDDTAAFDIGATLGDTSMCWIMSPSYSNAGDSQPQQNMARMGIISATQIDVTRAAASGAAIPFAADIVECSAAVKVARGLDENPSGAQSVDIDLSGTFSQSDLGTVFPFVTQQRADSGWTANPTWTAEIVDDGTKLVLRITQGGGQTNNSVYDWEVVQFGTGAEAWSVDSGSVTFTSADLTKQVTGLAAVDRGKTFLWCSARGNNDPSRVCMKAYMDSDTSVTFERGDAGTNDVILEWHRCEFQGGETVEEVDLDMVAADVSDSHALATAVSDTGNAAFRGSSYNAWGKMSHTGSGIVGEAAQKVTFASTSQVDGARESSNGSTNLIGYVVDFAPGGAAAASLAHRPNPLAAMIGR